MWVPSEGTLQGNRGKIHCKSAATRIQAQGEYASIVATEAKIDATIEVKPLLMKIPFIADTVDKQLCGKRWYAVQYSGVLGY